MAQLSDDCFAFGGPMMSVDEAVGLIATRVTPVVDVERVMLAQADGRILAHDVLAPLPLPPFTNSAVDGYAVSSRDLPQNQERAFPVIGRVQAGSSRSGRSVTPAPRAPCAWVACACHGPRSAATCVRASAGARPISAASIPIPTV